MLVDVVGYFYVLYLVVVDWNFVCVEYQDVCGYQYWIVVEVYGYVGVWVFVGFDIVVYCGFVGMCVVEQVFGIDVGE